MEYSNIIDFHFTIHSLQKFRRMTQDYVRLSHFNKCIPIFPLLTAILFSSSLHSFNFSCIVCKDGTFPSTLAEYKMNLVMNIIVLHPLILSEFPCRDPNMYIFPACIIQFCYICFLNNSPPQVLHRLTLPK